MSGIVDLYYFIFRNGIAKNGIENRIRPNCDVSIVNVPGLYPSLEYSNFQNPNAIAKTIGQYRIFNNYITSICLMVLILHKNCYPIKQKLKKVLQQQQKINDRHLSLKKQLLY